MEKKYIQKGKSVSVAFVGAGPGDPELITVKGKRWIERADLVLYAGSLVPEQVIGYARKDARVVDSSSLTLDETHALIVDTVNSGGLVARVHTGDPSLYGAIREQMILLDREGISYEVIPGVTAAFAAAARAGVSFTIPERCQSLIFTRMEGRTKMPDNERLELLASHQTSMAIYLSAAEARRLQDKLISGGYPPDTPIVVGYRVGWPDEMVFSTRLGCLAGRVKEEGITRQAVFLVLPGQDEEGWVSRLYSKEFSHGFRK